MSHLIELRTSLEARLSRYATEKGIANSGVVVLEKNLIVNGFVLKQVVGLSTTMVFVQGCFGSTGIFLKEIPVEDLSALVEQLEAV